MTHHQRETEKDRRAQREILEFFSGFWQCNITETPPIHKPGGQKYRLDAWLTRKGDNTRFCFMECKGYTDSGFYGLNVPKYRDGCELARAAMVPFILGFSQPGGYGYVVVLDKDGKKAPFTSRVTGKTPKGRPENFDDKEPMVMFPKSCVHFCQGFKESA